MRHRKAGRKLSRTSSHRLAMFRNLVTSVLEHERVMTTDAKAKEIRRWVDWMITLGKKGDLAARRQALKVIRDKSIVHKLFAELAPRYQNVSGGYSRVIKIGYRRGDGAPMSMIELVDFTGVEKKRPKKKKKKEKIKAEAPQVEQEVAEKVEEKVEEGEQVAEAEETGGEEAKEAEAESAAPEDEVSETESIDESALADEPAGGEEKEDK